MTRLHERTSLLVRYIASNVLIVLLPITLLGYVFVTQMYDQLLDNVIGNQQGALEYAARQFSDDINRFTAMGVQISDDPYVTPYNLRRSGSTQLDVRSRMEQHRTGLEYGCILGIYLEADDMFYSNRGAVSLENFASFQFRTQGELDIEGLREWLCECSAFSVLPQDMYLTYANSSDHDRYTLWAMPYPADSAHPFGAVVAVIEDSFYRDRLGGATGDLEICLRAEDALGQLLYEHQSGYGPKVDGWSDDAILLSAQVGKTGWQIEAAFPRSQFRNALTNGISEGTRALIVLVALASLLLGVYCAYSQFKPIDQINRSVRQSGHHMRSKNELVNISDAYRDVVVSNQLLQRKVAAHQLLIVESLLHEMLLGNRAESEEAYVRRLHEGGVQLDARWLCVILIRPDAQVSMTTLKELAHFVEETFAEQTYSVVLAGNRCAALLLNREDGGTGDLAVWGEQIADAIYRQWYTTIAIGISNVFENRSEADSALLEAAAALEISRMRTDARTTCYGELRRENVEHDLGAELLQVRMRMTQSVTFGSEENYRDAAAQVRELFKRNAHLPGNAHLLGALVCDALQLLAEYEPQGADEWGKRLAGLSHADAYFSIMDEIREGVHEVRVTRKNNERSSLAENVVRYVDEHISDPELSLTAVAETFGMSDTRLSRFFKQCTSATFKEYLTAARMKEACRLLEQTDEKIGDIVRKVGYTDATSFARRFAAEYGMSASMWRDSRRR